MESAIIEAREEADQLECAAHGNMEQASGDGHYVKKALYMKVTGGKPTYFPKKEQKMESAIIEVRGETDRLECAVHENMGQVSGDDHHAKEALCTKGLEGYSLAKSVNHKILLRRRNFYEKNYQR
mgnify:FL=1